MSDTTLTVSDEEFSPGNRRRGDALHRQGRVSIEKRSDSQLCARVRATPHAEVVLTLDGATITSQDCTCSDAESNGECAHIWATIREANRGADAGWRGNLAPRRGPIPIPGATTRSSLSSPREEPDWKTYLERLQRLVGLDRGPRWPRSVTGETQLLFWLSCARLDRTYGDPAVAVIERRRTRTGWGEPRPFQLNERSLEQVLGGLDLQLLELLLPFTGSSTPWAARARAFSQAPITLPGRAGAEVLGMLARSGRLLPRERIPEEFPPIGIDPDPWRFSFRIVDAKGKRGKHTLAASFHRQSSGEQRATLEEATLVTPAGWVLVRGQLSPYENPEDGAWIRALSMSPPEIPSADVAAFCEGILAENPGAPFEPPEGVALAIERRTPRPHLVIRRTSGPRRGTSSLTASLTFEYGGSAVLSPDDEAESVRDGDRIVPRDMELERSLVQELLSLGPRRSTQSESFSELTIPAGRLPSVIETLLSREWRVTSEGKIHRPASEFDVKIRSGIDWLDLSGSVDFEGHSVPFPRLLAAVQGGSRTIELDDGSFGILSGEWLRRSGMLAEFGEVENGEVRFRPSQAWVLDTLLEGVPNVDVDAEFARLRERLRAFEGVEPREEPASFTGELRPYQREALGWLDFLREYSLGGCLADDMGLGKTVQVIAHLERLRSEGRLEKPVLVVAPRSVVEHWKRESHRFAPELSVIDVSGPDRDELRAGISKANLVLITYGILRMDIRHLREVQFDTVILDEAQAIKNARSQTAKAARLIRADHRLALSGTPIENHLGELWSLFEFLQPGMLGRASRFGRLTQAGLDEPASDDDDELESDGEESVAPDGRRRHSGIELLARAVRPFILRRTKGQVATDLPERTELTIRCDLEPEQRTLYEELAEHYRASLLPAVQGGAIGSMKMQVIQALLRLRQAACHPGLIDPALKSGTSGKLETIVERIEELREEGHRCLVFSQFTTFLGIVRERLDAKKIPYEYLDGRTRRRQEVVDRFQEDGQGVAFLISLKAGGLGLNLTAADYVFILDPWWNPASEAQAIDRAHRIGQTRHVFAYRLIAPNTVEDKIVELQKRKRALADAIIAADEGLVKSLTAEDLEFILSH